MSLKRWAAKRDSSESAIVETLRAHGATVHHISQPCDLIIGLHGQTVLAEAKTGKKKLKAHQQDAKDRWNGGRWVVLRTAADAEQLAKDVFRASQGAK